MASGASSGVSPVSQIACQVNCSLCVVQFIQHPMEAQPEKDWSSDLFDCFEDASTCCYGFWCGPFLACTVAGRFGENRCLPLCDTACGMPLCVPPAVLAVRVAMRNRYHIKGSICNDILVSLCCQWCSWCQMHRELKHRNKTPNFIVVQNQPIVQMQPAAMMMVPQAGFVSQPGVTVISH
ncbi:cornifelin homolog B-like isoform X2 [Eleginops maclovinus]|uniref:cornifelin homolog B-like isoform X2 n=1 Tax=Eleginops maclovinus TaxID=56733 RepID=UPI003080BA76